MSDLVVLPGNSRRKRVDGRPTRLKAAIVGRAEVIGVSQAAREAGLPESTVRYWRESPVFAELREQKREDVAADVWAVFQKGVRRIQELIPLTDDMGKVAIATGILYDKHALMSGQATSRTETRATTDALNDHEKDALRAILESVIAAEVPA